MAIFGPPTKYTRQDLLDIVGQVFEDHWIRGLLADPSSSSVFAGMADMMLRVQDAVDTSVSIGLFLLSAPGIAPATSSVRINNPSAAATIEPNIRFRDDRGAIWRVESAVDIPAGPTTVDVPIRTDRGGYFLNSEVPLTFVSLDPLPNADMAIEASSLSVATGGTSPQLDILGDARGFPRASAESDTDYRTRLRFLDDAVSPQAITRAVTGILEQYPATSFIANLITRSGLRTVREPFRSLEQVEQENLNGLDAAFADDITFLDDTPGSGPILRSLADQCAFFDVLLPTPRDPNEARHFLDDGFFDDPTLGYRDLPPGEAILAPIAALAAELDRIRSACVRFRVIQGEDGILRRAPVDDSTGVIGSWQTQAGSTTLADMITSLQAFRGDEFYLQRSVGRGSSTFISFEDFLLDWPALVELPVSVTNVSIRARVRRADISETTEPILSIVVQPPSSGLGTTIIPGQTVDHDDWRDFVVVLEQNPITAAAWTVADVTGLFRIGLANTAAAGNTQELRVAGLSLAIEANYG